MRHSSSGGFTRIAVLLLGTTLQGCVLLDPYNMRLMSRTEESKEFKLNVWMPSISDGETSNSSNLSVEMATLMLHDSSIPNIETCAIEPDSLHITYRSSWATYDVNCDSPITFNCNEHNVCSLNAGAKW